MNTPKLLFPVVLSLVASFANAEPATEQSVRELLVVSGSVAQVDRLKGVNEAIINQMMEPFVKGKSLTPRQQQAVDRVLEKTKLLVAERLSREKIIDLQVRLNRELFTEEEIRGLINFYQTDAGRALRDKAHVLALRTAIETQKIVQSISVDVKKTLEELRDELP